MSDPVKKILYDVVSDGLDSDVSSLLRDPEINVNWTDDYQWTSLHAAVAKLKLPNCF